MIRPLVRSGAAQYACLRCERRTWRAGGVAALGKHLATVHLLPGSRLFPTAQPADATGQALNFAGEPTDLNPATEGLIRIGPIVGGRLS